MYYIYGVSVPSLLIESTDSMIGVGSYGTYHTEGPHGMINNYHGYVQ